jgi:glucose-6-phosphate 1-dehydrogenase
MTTEKTNKQKAGPCILVIFGTGGDLTRRKLIPSIYHLLKAERLSPQFAVVGFSSKKMSQEQFKAYVASALGEQIKPADLNHDLVQRVSDCFRFFEGDLKKAESYQRLKNYLDQVCEEKHTEGNCLFYFATPPELVDPIVKGLGNAGMLAQEKSWRRVVVEKPFGHDLESAKALNQSLGQMMTEDQIFRIDHYLGKETVQNILVFRFANGIYEPIWNRNSIDSVQITAAESLGVENRADYYEKAGALRDMIVNHLLQLFSLVAMESPTSFEGEAISDEKVKILKSIKPLSPEAVLKQVVRGQYNEGTIDGVKVRAYRTEPGVAPKSNTETYVALKLEVDNERWAGVPFYLRSGKHLSEGATEIAIQLKRVPHELFKSAGSVSSMPSNFLVMHIHPTEGISLNFAAKKPGPEIQLQNVEMNFKYADSFQNTPSTGYETLLYDCMKGDQTLFRRADQVIHAWAFVTPILEAWSALPPRDFPNYASGTSGPIAADELLQRDGRQWRNIQSIRGNSHAFKKV